MFPQPGKSDRLTSVGYFVLKPLHPVAPVARAPAEEATPAPVDAEVTRVPIEQEPAHVPIESGAECVAAEDAEANDGPKLLVSGNFQNSNTDDCIISSDDEAPMPAAQNADKRSRSRSPHRHGQVAISASNGDVVVDCIDLDADPVPHFYVECIQTATGCCAVCRQFFKSKQRRFGFQWQSATAPEWVHAPKCVRKANFDVHLEEHIAFEANEEEFFKSRVLEELVAKHEQQKDVTPSKKVATSAKSVVAWRFGDDDRSWNVMPVKAKATSSSFISCPGLAELIVQEEVMACMGSRFSTRLAMRESAKGRIAK